MTDNDRADVGPFKSTRRDVLKAFTCGAGGLTIGSLLGSPRIQAATVTQAPPLLVQGAFPNGNVSATGTAAYSRGMLFVRTTVGSGFDIQFVDVHSSTLRYSFVNQFQFTPPSTPFKLPVADATQNVVYTGVGNTIYTVDVNGGFADTWSPLGGSLLTELIQNGGLLLCVTDDGKLQALDPRTQKAAWSVPITIDANNVAITCSANSVFILSKGLLQAYRSTGGRTLWSVSAKSPSGSITATATATTVYVSGSDGFVRAYDATNNGAPLWTYPGTAPLATPLSVPSYANGRVYVVDNVGKLHSILAAGPKGGTADGAPLAFAADLDHTMPLQFEDGIVYGAVSQGGLAIYAMSITDGEITRYTTGKSGDKFLGVENGTCFFTHNNGTTLNGVSLSVQSHGFFAESELMAEDYTTKAGSTVPGTPAYRTHVRLQDPNNNPRINKAVKIWASDPVNITSGTKTKLVSDENSAIWLTTDNLGELSFVCQATNITCPAIYLWGTFMDQQGEAMVIYPDESATTQLANVNGGALTQAKTFDGASLLPSGFTGASDLATHISNTMNGVSGGPTPTNPSSPAPGSSPLLRHRPKPILRGADTYVAYPGACPNLFYTNQYDPSNTDVQRPFSAKQTVTGTLKLGPGSASFNPSTPASVSLGFSFSSWRDVVQQVVHNAEAVVTEVAVTVETEAQKAIHAITVLENNISKTLNLVIDSIEAAAAAVASVLKSVVSAIGRGIEAAIEWLSTVFAWDKIVGNAKQIRDGVTSKLQGFETWIASRPQTAIDDLFKGMEKTISDAINSWEGDLSGGTLKQQQKNGNNPQSLYSRNGTNSYTKSQWLGEKLKANTGTAQPGGQASSVGIRSDQDPIFIAISGFQTEVGALLRGSAFTHVPGDLHNLATDFGNLIKDPTQFAAQSLKDVLEVIKDIAIGLVQFLAAIIKSFLDQLPNLVKAASDIITGAIPIPVISDLWSTITSNKLGPLSMLGIVSLVIAVPATILMEVTSTASDSSAAPGDGLGTIEFYTTLFAGVMYAFFDAFNDATGVSGNTPEAIAGLACSVILWTTGFTLPPPTDTISVIWNGVGVFPLAYAALSIYAARNWTVESGDFISELGGALNIMYGIAMYCFAFVGFKLNPSDFDDPHHLSVTQNVFANFPYFAKIFAQGESGSPSRIVVSIIDALCDLTTLGLAEAKLAIS